jgi:hypothetical protein
MQRGWGPKKGGGGGGNWEGSGICLIEVRLTSPKFSGVNEKKHKNSQPRYSLSRQRYKLGTSRTPGQRFIIILGRKTLLVRYTGTHRNMVKSHTFLNEVFIEQYSVNLAYTRSYLYC